MNPGMSSWIALRLRAPIQAGQSVFILGATGNAGRMAIQIAKLLGAGQAGARRHDALLSARRDRSRPLSWIQIGAIAGPTMELPWSRSDRRICA
jgi:hypothetical protein